MKIVHGRLVIAFAFVALALATPAAAHELYPPECCNERDCFEVPAGGVTPTPDGWRIEATGEVIPYSRAEIALPEAGGTFHRCSQAGDPNGATLNFRWGPRVGQACLFTAPGGS